MTFPSGAIVQIQFFEIIDTFANIMVSIPSEYYGTTSGLCGTSDGIASNDMQDRNEKIYERGPESWNSAPAEFTESWR